MKNLLLLVSLFFTVNSFAQTWSDDVAEIVYNKCSKCHHDGGVGPFPLMSYTETSQMATVMYDAIAQEEMPPWPPNNDYQQFVHDRSLTPSEKTTMLDWLTNGTPEGNPANTPPPPVFEVGSILGEGDLELQIPTYMSKALNGSDDYVCFALDSELPTDRVIKSVEVIPGNREIVHHALIYIDPTNSSVTDTVGGDCGSPSSAAAFLTMGYTPGSSPLTLPAVSPLKLGMTMPANSQVVFAMHYPEGSYGEYDSTKVIFHFYPPGVTGVRDVYSAAVLQEWSMVIPPNEFDSVSTQYPPSGGLQDDISILSVFPHMHLLGESMTVYGVDSNQDTIKFIDVPHWDFEWQDFYFFKNIQRAPIGTTLYAEGVYNNTSGNLHNPNNPPQTVYAGLNTADEMFMVYAHFMAWEEGDEDYDIEDLMNQSTSSIVEATNETSILSVYPNPFNDQLRIYSEAVNSGDIASIYIYDAQGKLVRKLMDQETITNDYLLLDWDGMNDSGKGANNGLYLISVNLNGTFSSHRIVKN